MSTTALTPSEAKTIRLLSEGRVKPLGEVFAFVVEGDHGRYIAGIGEDASFCTCPASGRCSHLDAAAIRLDADPATSALLDQAVADRVERGVEA